MDEQGSSSPSAGPSEAPRGSIGGTVLEDTNNDDDGDVGLSGVLILLKDEAGVAVLRTTLTDATGSYLFEDLPLDSYVVMEMNLPGFTDVSDVDPTSGVDSIGVTIGGSEPADSTGNDFVDERTSTVSGVVLEDTDEDGEGEEPISGVEVSLVDESGSVVGTTLTDSEGGFEFEDVPPGTYEVTETTPAGFDLSLIHI